MPGLTLRRDNLGNPNRLYLTATYGQRNQVKRAGLGLASWMKSEKKWSFPPDPRIVAALWDEFDGHITFSAEVEEYLDSLVAKQEAIIAASVDESPFLSTGPLERLRPYQRSSLRFLLEAKRAILAHEMGVGKTVIVATAALEAEFRRVLLVVPNSAKFHWAQHMVDWANWDPADLWIIDPAKSDRWQTIRGAQRDAHLRLALEQRTMCLVLTYEMMVRVCQDLLAHQYDLLVYDEAHHLKNRKAQRTEQAVRLSREAGSLYLVTGTPVRNDYDELWTLLYMVDPNRFSSFWGFVRSNLNFQEGFWGGVELLGLRDPDAWDRMMSVYMVRKTKKDVLPDLPDKIYVDLELSMTLRQAKLYEQMERELEVVLSPYVDEEGEVSPTILSAPNTIAQIIRLRQLCLTPAILGGPLTSAKLDALRDIFEEAKESGEQMVVFCTFATFLPFVRSLLDELEISHASIEGSVPAAERREVEGKLNDGSVQVVVGTIGAMGETLNLQAASTAVFCDLDWVPAANQQAEDRIHRLGTKTSPRIVRLIHRGTIEEDILSVIKHKEHIAGQAVGRFEVVRSLMARRGGEKLDRAYPVV